MGQFKRGDYTFKIKGDVPTASEMMQMEMAFERAGLPVPPYVEGESQKQAPTPKTEPSTVNVIEDRLRSKFGLTDRPDKVVGQYTQEVRPGPLDQFGGTPADRFRAKRAISQETGFTPHGMQTFMDYVAYPIHQLMTRNPEVFRGYPDLVSAVEAWPGFMKKTGLDHLGPETDEDRVEKWKGLWNRMTK